MMSVQVIMPVLPSVINNEKMIGNTKMIVTILIPHEFLLLPMILSAKTNAMFQYRLSTIWVLKWWWHRALKRWIHSLIEVIDCMSIEHIAYRMIAQETSNIVQPTYSIRILSVMPIIPNAPITKKGR